MRSWLSIVFVGVSGLALVACGGSGTDGPRGGGGTGGTGGVILSCDTLDPPPPGCNDACPSGSDSECMSGTHCLNGSCAAQCTDNQGCGGGSSCNVRGRCVPDIGTGGNGGTGNTSGCQSVMVTPTRSIPNVMFLVDRSGSMVSELDGSSPEPGEPTRWRVAHDAIEAVMGETESIVRFGLSTYHWNDDEYSLNNSPPDPECPIVGPAGASVQNFVPVGFALDNASAILGLYPQEFPNDPSGTRNDTPTGESIDKLAAWIDDNPPPPGGPTIIVLATDGEPDSCMYPDSNRDIARQLSVDAAEAAYLAGIQTYVLSVGSDVGAGHLQDMANAGAGDPPQDAQFWVGTDPASLEIAFRDIIKDSISCEIVISKPFNEETLDQACEEGDVALNGVPLDCPSDWQVKDEAPYNVIELLGSACQTLKSGEVTFTAEFPCGTIIVE